LGTSSSLTPEGSSHKSYRFSASAATASDTQLPPLTDLLIQINETRQGITVGDAHKDSIWQVAPDDPTRA